MDLSHNRLVFADIDGVLLDYPADTPPPYTLFREPAAGQQFVLVSSHTLDELQRLEEALATPVDLIGENGAFIATHSAGIADTLQSSGSVVSPSVNVQVASLASPRSAVRMKVNDAIRNSGSHAIVADDLSPGSLARLSGHDVDSASLVLRRRHSVLLHDVDSKLVDRLHLAGLSVSHIGRWMVVVEGSNRGRAVRAYCSAAGYGAGGVTTVGVGGSPEDETMLRSVNYAFILKRPEGGYAPQLTGIPGATHLAAPGANGWREMFDLLEWGAAGDAD